MLKTKDILDEKDKRLRVKSKEVEFPLRDEDIKIIDEIIEYLTNSQIEELAEKYDLRPGWGLSPVQVGSPKRYIVVVHEIDEGVFDEYVLINPKIVSTSQELLAVDVGEGCLSVNREIEGHVPRHARITVEAYDMDGNKVKIRAREELAVVFQHEIDHLNGILFFDHINPKKPFYDEKDMRLI